jgi:DNA ligase (NAD+)
VSIVVKIKKEESLLDKLQRIKELTKQLNEASYEYYNTGHPIMEDSEFDILLDELQKLENESGIVMEDSPTINAGSRVAKEQKKITHEHPMLSLDKIHSVEEIQKFIGNQDVIASVKLDGLTCSLTYINGDLKRLESRGNGEIGTDLLIHKNSISGIPLHINHHGKYVIDGECIVKYDDFQAINDKLPEEEQFSNPRNMASGSLNLLDSNISATRGLTFIAWNVIEDSEDFKPTMLGNFCKASGLGFNVVPFVKVENTNNGDLDNILETIKHISNSLSLPMDGCVFSHNDIAYGKSLGRTSHHFNHSIAYKYEDDCAETTLRAVEWTMGKVGSLCPTAVFDTVQLEGTEVNRASLHNVSICKSLEIGIGDTITVKKCNQIIPQLQDNLTRSNTLKIPTQCPICGENTKIVKENESEVLMCTNPDCKGKLLGKLTHFVSKNAANIDGLSEQTLQKFIDLGWLNTFKDIYHLSDHKAQMYNLDGFGKKSVDKLLENIKKSRDIDLSHFLYSLSIPLIGKTASKDIAKVCNNDFQTFVDIVSLESEYTFMNIDGFGKEMNASLRRWWNENKEMCLNLSKEFRFKEKDNDSKSDKKVDLSDKTFVITGSLTHFKNRSELVSIIEELGGKVSGSVSTKTSYLINNDTESNSSKNKKAKELDIPIISEEDFIKMIS